EFLRHGEYVLHSDNFESHGTYRFKGNLVCTRTEAMEAEFCRRLVRDAKGHYLIEAHRRPNGFKRIFIKRMESLGLQASVRNGSKADIKGSSKSLSYTRSFMITHMVLREPYERTETNHSVQPSLRARRGGREAICLHRSAGRKSVLTSANIREH